MAAAVLLRKRNHSMSGFREFSFPKAPKWSKENTIFLKFVVALVLISIFVYFVRKWFFFDFALAKTKHSLAFFETTSTKPKSSSGLWDFVSGALIGGDASSGFTQGISAALQGVKQVTKSVQSVTEVYKTTADNITLQVVDTVGSAVEQVVDNFTTVVGGVKGATSGDSISWSLMGGSGILGILLALLFIL